MRPIILRALKGRRKNHESPTGCTCGTLPFFTDTIATPTCDAGPCRAEPPARFLPRASPPLPLDRHRHRPHCERAPAWIGSGDGDCAPAPSHTTGHTVFRIRRLDPAAVPTRRKTGRPPTIYRLPCLVHRFLSGWTRHSPWLPPASARHGSTASASACSPFHSPRRGRTLRPGTPGNLWGACVSRSSSFAPWSFGPLLQRRYPPSSLLWPLLTSPSLSRRSSPQVRCCFCPFIPSGSTSHVWMDFGLH